MIDFLQKNAEWICAIALVIFAYMQWKITKYQAIQELRLKRLALAQSLDKYGAEFFGTRDCALKMMQVIAENQSNFKFLLCKKSYKHVEELFQFLHKLRNSDEPNHVMQLKNTLTFNEYLNNLTDALCNADYGMVKYKSENDSLKKYHEIIEKLMKK